MADQNLFINLFKRLAPGRAAGGVFNLTASGGKGGEATLGKNTLKAGCECAFPLVPRGEMIREEFRKTQAKPVYQPFQKVGPRQGRRRHL